MSKVTAALEAIKDALEETTTKDMMRNRSASVLHRKERMDKRGDMNSAQICLDEFAGDGCETQNWKEVLAVFNQMMLSVPLWLRSVPAFLECPSILPNQ